MTVTADGRAERTQELPDEAAIMPRAGGENFAVAALLLGREARDHLLAIYGFARLVDQLGDEVEGDRLAKLDALEAEVDRVFGGTPQHPLMQRLQATARACPTSDEPLHPHYKVPLEY